MKDKSMKIEKYRMWFSDLKGTAELLREKSCEGWHITEIDVSQGKFTYKKWEPKNYCYEFSVNGICENLAIYDENSGFEKILEDSGLALYRREEESPESLEAVKKSFGSNSTEEEEKWLSDQAAEGYFLLRCNRPEYTFFMCEKSTVQFKADYAPNVENPKEYLEKFKNAGWEYIWGSNGYHYFCTETPEAVDSSVFNSERNAEDILRDKKRQISGILGMALFGLAASFLKLYLDVSAYSQATQDILEKVGRSVAMDLIAALICGGFVIGSIIAYLKAKHSK